MNATEMELIDSGNSASCAAVRSRKYGHLVVVKAYHEQTEKILSDTEAKVYEYLSKLQGINIPLILGKVSAVFAGTRRRIIVMSYGGIPLHRCTGNNELVEELANACIAMYAHGIVLDDSSPNNVLVHGTKVAVIDFEMAYIVDPPSPEDVETFATDIRRLAEKVKVSGNLNALLP